jgi:hypothetical protein
LAATWEARWKTTKIPVRKIQYYDYDGKAKHFFNTKLRETGMLECKPGLNLQKVQSLALLYMSIYPAALKHEFLVATVDIPFRHSNRPMHKKSLETSIVRGMQKEIPRFGTNVVNTLYGVTSDVTVLFMKVGGGHIRRSRAIPPVFVYRECITMPLYMSPSAGCDLLHSSSVW